MKFCELRIKFLNKFLIDGKKYNSFFLLNNVFYYLHLQNKNTTKIFLHFFKIIEPLFCTEKIVFMSRVVQRIVFLKKKRRIRVILNMLKEFSDKNQKLESKPLSYSLSQEIYNSAFKTSEVYNICKLQNESFLKLKNNSNYKWL